MGCEAWLAKLDLYLDGELLAEEMRACDAHLRVCRECAAEGFARLQLRRTVRQAGRAYQPSAEFRRRMERQVAGAKKPFRLWTWAPALAAALLLVAALGLYRGTETRGNQAVSELADLHVATLASVSPVDVVSSDRHTVKPWFEGRIPFTFNLPDLAGSPFTLLGGRVTYLGQVPGAHLLCQVRQHRISIFIFQQRTAGTILPADMTGRNFSYSVASTTAGGLNFILVGDVASEELQALASRWRDANRT
jgi:anti-sigma factor RsiW